MIPWVLTATLAFTAVSAADVASAHAATLHTSTARPVKLAKVGNLHAAATITTAGYDVDSRWSAVTGATGYAVRLVNHATGVTLSTARVSGLSWATTSTLSAGTVVDVRVKAVAGTRKGPEVSTSVTLPRDTQAPQGTFSVQVTTGPSASTVTVTQTGLSDNGTPAADIVREITWDASGDGTEQFQPWTSGTDAVSTTVTRDGVYHAQVRLTDKAGNRAVVPVTFTVNDTTPPSAAYAARPGTVYARWTAVSLSESAFHDDFSRSAYVQRRVSWGDGATSTWYGAVAPRHVYRTAGRYTLAVTLTDEAGNVSAPVSVPVTVVADSVAPAVTVIRPHAPRRVVSWQVVRGTAKDTGVGVRVVKVRVVERRAGIWFAYRPGTGTWVKAGRTQARAVRMAPWVAARLSRTGAWSTPLARLRTGTLVLRTKGTDHVGNTSVVRTTSQLLTH